MRALPRRSAGGRRRRCRRDSRQPIAGMSIMRPAKSSVRSPEQELATDHLTADLGRRSRRGGAVLMAAQAVRVVGQMATLVVLARLLQPEAFGLLAMVAAI